MVTDGSMLYSHPRFCLVHTTDTCTNVQLLPSDNVCVRVCWSCLVHSVINLNVKTATYRLPVLSVVH